MEKRVRFLAVVNDTAYFFEKTQQIVVPLKVDQTCMDLLIKTSKSHFFTLARKFISTNGKEKKVSMHIISKLDENEYETKVSIKTKFRKRKIESSLNETLPFFADNKVKIYIHTGLLKKEGIPVNKDILKEATAANFQIN